MPKNRANNDGMIIEDKTRNGWRVAITLPDGSRKFKRFKDREIAKQWLDEKHVEISKGTFVMPSELTLAEWLIEWLAVYSKPHVRQRTYDRYKSLAKHCEPIADKALQDLNPHDFQKLYVESLAEYSGETKKKVHNLLRAALKQAVLNKLIQYNPLDGVTTPKVVREEIVTFSVEELQSILVAAKGHRWYPSLLLAAHTGMR